MPGQQADRAEDLLPLGIVPDALRAELRARVLRSIVARAIS
jgi:hypothetical protein